MDEREPVTPEVNQAAPQPSGEGRRLAPRQGLDRKGKIALGVCAAVLAALVGGYLGLCAFASGQRVLPGVCVGDADLSGMTLSQAEERIGTLAQDIYDQLEIPIHVGDRVVSFQAAKAGVRAEGVGQRAVQEGKEHFLASGWNYLAGLAGRKTPVTFTVVLDKPGYVTRIMDIVSHAVDHPVEDPHYEVEETEDAAALVFYRGQTGQSVDRQAVYDDLMAALAAQGGTVTARVLSTPPAKPDYAAIKGEIDRAPENASLDVETDKIIPHKLGLRVEESALRGAFDGLGEGESGRIELAVEQPEITTLQLRAGLFRDVLGEGSSKISGDANRVGNVRLAAAACDGVVLLPGEQMSYNKTTGQRTTAKGYREASGYTSKGIEDMVGGGVCQPSSTLYLACLNANLEIVERKNHMYTVSYMPDGMDATVSWPNLDYVFANNTPYPIKVEMKIENKVLTVRIYGTKTDNTYVKMESVRLSTTPAGVTYQADETVPQGTTKILQAAHTGKKVEVYKNLYAGDGTLISRTLISTDTYRPGDKIVGYNPLDGAPDGSVAPTGEATDPESGAPVDPNTGELIGPAPEDTEPAQPDVDNPAQPADPGQVPEGIAPEPVGQAPAAPAVPEGPATLPAVPQPVEPPEGIPLG